MRCEDAALKNTFRFKYLGSIFAADGDQRYDVRRRVGLAMDSVGKLTHVFNTKIPFGLKMKICECAV